MYSEARKDWLHGSYSQNYTSDLILSAFEMLAIVVEAHCYILQLTH